MGKGEKKGKVCTNCGQGRRWIQKSDEEDKSLEKDRQLGRCEGMAASSWSPFFFPFDIAFSVSVSVHQCPARRSSSDTFSFPLAYLPVCPLDCSVALLP